MSLEFSISQESFANLPENAKGFYQKQENGGYQLDVTGVVPQNKLTEAEKLLSEAKAKFTGPEGKTYQEMFEGAKGALDKARAERDAAQTELKSWKEFGTVEDVQKIKTELEGFKATGKTLEVKEQEIVTLKQSNRELGNQLATLKGEKESLSKQNEELASFKKEAERKADLYDAEQKIGSAVEGIKEANQKALKLHLMDRYRNGELIRDSSGNLISRDDAAPLTDYAKEKMEAYGLYAKSTPGYSFPDGGKGGAGGGAANSIDALFAGFHGV